MTTERSGMSLESAWDAIQILRKGTPFPPGVSAEMLADAFYKAAFSHCTCSACQITHASDCAVHNEPAMPKGPCDCGASSNDEAYLSAIREISRLKDEIAHLSRDAVVPAGYVLVPVEPTEEMLKGLTGPAGYTSIPLAEAYKAMLAQRDGGK